MNSRRHFRQFLFWLALICLPLFGIPSQVAGAPLQEMEDQAGAAVPVATDSDSLNPDSKLFQARFDSSDWTGQLLAFRINPDGSVDDTPVWDAGARINNQNFDTGREIITWNPDIDNPPGDTVEGAGVPFRFPSDYTSPGGLSGMSTSQVADLMTNGPHDIATVNPAEILVNQSFGEDIVNYLRGDKSNELAGRNFRRRASVLGDIINSDPGFVGRPTLRYPDTLESKSYDRFRLDNADRQGMVYVGANDGMLHGFNADTGDEMLAFVPAGVYRNLAELAEADYEHRYYVDGGPNIIDMFLRNRPDPGGGPAGVWRTVLAGALARGGQSVYALDVTEPAAFDEANAGDLILWEFDHGDDADLGYSHGKVQLAKMNNGAWAAVFGNGYNNTETDGHVSTSGHGVLYIVDVESGDILKKLDTETGSNTAPNGLATPLLIDVDQDFDADYVYSGDLEGNMWKFDVTGATAAAWDVAWRSGTNPEPLFTTASDQPITSQPQVSFHPDNLPGFMIFFGTGRPIDITGAEESPQTTQTFYGIWDKNTTAVPDINPVTDLLQQTITNQYEQSFDMDGDSIDDKTYTLRDISDNEIDWNFHLGWKLDLIPRNIEGRPNALNFGERQVSQAMIRNGRVIFTTLIPSTAEGEFGGASYLMEVDFRDGGALKFPAFDLNGDDEYDADDTHASGRASDVGMIPALSILADDTRDVVFGSGAGGDIDVIELSVGDRAFGRQSWRQLE